MTSSKKAQDVNMNNKETNLIWIDLEMTGLLPTVVELNADTVNAGTSKRVKANSPNKAAIVMT